MMTKEGSTKNVNFMTPRAGVFVLGRGYISHIVKMHYFFNNPGIDLTKKVCSNDDQGRVYRNCKFHISHYSEYVLSSSLSINFTLVAIVLKDYDAALLLSYTIVNFFFFIKMRLLL